MKLEKIKPVTPVRKYLITLTHLPCSVESAEQCLASAKRYGEEYNLEIFPAVDQYRSESFFTEHGLVWETPKRTDCERTTYEKAAMGCFASHFSLWLKCMELNEPILVMEHDVVFVSKIPALKFKHVASLSRNEEWMRKPLFLSPRNTEIHYPNEHLMGAGAYAISPAGARVLVEKAHGGAVLPTDWFIRKSLVHIVGYYPMPFYHASRFSSIQSKPIEGKDYKTAEAVWSEYNFDD